MSYTRMSYVRLLAASFLLVSGTVVAQAQVQPKASTQQESVESVAARICPQAYDIGMRGGNTADFVTRVGLMHGYSVDDRLRLLRACTAYVQAQLDRMQGRR